MIKINEVCYILGLTEVTTPSDAIKGEARAVLKFFGVEGKEGDAPSGFGKAPKVYDEAKVRRIAEVRAGF